MSQGKNARQRFEPEVLRRAAKAAREAQLPAGYQWGEDAMESFNFGKERAALAVEALLPFDGTLASASRRWPPP